MSVLQCYPYKGGALCYLPPYFWMPHTSAMSTILNDMSKVGEFAALGHGRLRYQVNGPEDGAKVVLVHGLIGHMHIWDRNFDTLVASGHRVLRMDIYGRGLSDRVKHPHNAHLFVNMLSDLLDHVGFTGPLHLIGLSMGGAVITRYASAFPDRVKSMLWVDSYGIVKTDDMLMRITRPQLVGEALIGTVGGFILRRAPDRGVHEPAKHKDFNRWFAAPLAVKGSKRALLSTLRNFMLDDHAPHFRTVQELAVPKLMVWGRHDRILPLSYGEQLHSLVPSARFETFERSGHLPHFEEPEHFNAMALDFLRKADG